MIPPSSDTAVRQAAFEFLREQQQLVGEDAVRWQILLRGFDYQGERVPLVSQQGIFKPRVMSLPLSLRTTATKLGQPRPYEDDLGTDGIISYRYRGRDPHHHENVGLQELYRRQLPVAHLEKGDMSIFFLLEEKWNMSPLSLYRGRRAKRKEHVPFIALAQCGDGGALAVPL